MANSCASFWKSYKNQERDFFSNFFWVDDLPALCTCQASSCRRVGASQCASAAMGDARPSSSKVFFLVVAFAVAGSSAARSSRPRPGIPTLRPIKSGIDVMSATLFSRQTNCKKGAASSEAKLSRLKYAIDNQWEEIAETDDHVKAMEEKMEELISLRQEHFDAAKDPDECSFPFKLEEQGCLWLHKNPGLPWEEARKRCQQSGADLATPSNLSHMREFLQREIGQEWWYVWVGGQITGHRAWLYVNGREGAAPAEDWHDTLNPGSCTALNGGRQYKMMAWNCEDPNWFLCQKF